MSVSGEAPPNAAHYIRAVPELVARPPRLHPDVCARALAARDARFDGIFVVAITTTRIYCRPVCPARVTYPERRRFYASAAAAERAGYRPCLRCRPELAPGRALCDAIPRLADAAAHRIGAGALNGRTVASLARELGVSERHLRRALEREIGVSPLELAQTHRLLLAKRLLADTALPVTRVAYASGFQSLRRFNSVFRERYRMSPSAVRRRTHASDAASVTPRPEGARAMRFQPGEGDLVRLTLAYRPPLAWDALVDQLRREAIPGVEFVHGRRYGRTVSLGGRRGAVFAEDAADARRTNGARSCVNVDVSPSLVPALMPLLARLRQLFDLDAEPTTIDAHLEQAGLGPLVRQRRGLRMLGALNGFETAFRLLLRAGTRSEAAARERARRVTVALGEPFETGIPGLSLLLPDETRLADAGAPRLAALGVPSRRAEGIVAIARAVVDGTLRLEPGGNASATIQALRQIGGVSDQVATAIVMRALYWPDAFSAADRHVQRAAGVSSRRELRRRAEQWRPWRAYAALHLGH
jgi:AraC family transcriptional regulator of adaptative response / DNA-3-methyladenine glycosylase II